MFREIIFFMSALAVVQCAEWNVWNTTGAFPNTPNAPNTPHTPRFIGSYKYLPGAGFYKLYKHKVSWGEAWEQCRDDNAHLLVIDSAVELDAVKTLMINSRSPGWAHIGVHDLFLNTHYVTVTGKSQFLTEPCLG